MKRDDDGLGYVERKKIKLVQGFGEKTGRKETTYKILKKFDKRVEWIQVSQERMAFLRTRK